MSPDRLLQESLSSLSTDVLEKIEEGLEESLDYDDGLLGWYGKKWAKDRLRAVSGLINDRAWTTTKWRKEEK